MKKLLGFVIAACLFAPGGVLGDNETICPEAITGGVSTIAGGNTIESTFIPQTIYGCTCQPCNGLVDTIFTDLCVQLVSVSNLAAAQLLIENLITGGITPFDVCDDGTVPGVTDSAECGAYIQQVVDDHIADILNP